MRCPDFIGDERGIALFIVLWVLVLLSVIAGEFSHAMRTAVNITRNFTEETRAYYIARAGANVAVRNLIRQETRPTRRVSVETADSSGINQDWRVNTDIPPVPFGGGSFQVRIENESGKVDINGADALLLRIMLNPFDLTDTEKDVIVDSILDWRDTDSFHHTYGAEDDYYLALAEPYEARDAPFLSIGELLLVRGITPDIFYSGLEKIVTVRSGEGGGGRNQVFGGGGKRGNIQNRININAASPKLLNALPGIGPEQIQEIRTFRAEKDIESPSELQFLLGMDISAAISPYVMFKNTAYFTVEARGMVSDSPVRSSLQVVVEIDPRRERKYRTVQWFEG